MYVYFVGYVWVGFVCYYLVGVMEGVFIVFVVIWDEVYYYYIVCYVIQIVQMDLECWKYFFINRYIYKIKIYRLYINIYIRYKGKICF